MAISYSQLAWNATPSASLILSTTFGADIAARSAIVVIVQTDTTTPTVQVADDIGGTYTQAGSYQSRNGTGEISLWYAENSAGGPCTVTVRVSSLDNFIISAIEYAGVATSAPLESSAGAQSSGFSPATGSITVGGAGRLVISAYGTTAGFVNTTAPTGFVNRLSVSPSSGFATNATGETGDGLSSLQISDYIGASTSQSPTYSQLADAGWVALGASFTAEPDASPPPPPPPAAPMSFGTPMMVGSPTWWLQFPLTWGSSPQNAPAPPPPTSPTTLTNPGPPPPPRDYPDGLGTPLVARLPGVDARLRRPLELLSIVINSLARTGQLVQTDIDEFEIDVDSGGGLLGVYPFPIPTQRQYLSGITIENGRVLGVEFTNIGSDDLNRPDPPVGGSYSGNSLLTFGPDGRLTGVANGGLPAPGVYTTITVNADGTWTLS